MFGDVIDIVFPPLIGAISAVIVFRVLNHFFGARYAHRQALADGISAEHSQIAASFRKLLKARF
jgi:hypothetical protein